MIDLSLTTLQDLPMLAAFEIRRLNEENPYWHDIFVLRKKEKKYILKLYNAGNSKERVEFELNCIKKLQKLNFKIPNLANILFDEQFIIEKEIKRVFVIFEFVEGKNPVNNLQDYKTIGKTIGKLHNISSKKLPNTSFKYSDPLLDIDTCSQKAIDVFNFYGLETSIVNKTVTEFKEMILNLDTLEDFGFIHGDIHPSNCIISPNKEVFLVDFDTCGKTWKYYELGVFLYNLIWEPHYRHLSMGIWSKVLKGYTSERKLKKSDHKKIHLFMLLRFFEVFNYSDVKSSQEFTKYHYNFLKGWVDHLNI